MEKILNEKAVEFLKSVKDFRDSRGNRYDVATDFRKGWGALESDSQVYTLYKNDNYVYSRREYAEVLNHKDGKDAYEVGITEDMITKFREGHFSTSTFDYRGLGFDSDEGKYRYLENGIIVRGDVVGCHDDGEDFSNGDEDYYYYRFYKNGDYFCSEDGIVIYDVKNDKIFINCVGLHLISPEENIREQVKNCIKIQEEDIEKHSVDLRNYVEHYLEASGYDVKKFALNDIDIRRYIRYSNYLDFSAVSYIGYIKEAYSKYEAFMNKYYRKLAADIKSLNYVLETAYNKQNGIKRTRIKEDK